MYYVYILASKPKGTLYIGFTSDLKGCVFAHKNQLAEGFTKRYGIHQLVYYEACEDFETALQREKRLKEWNRMWKFRLIEETNPAWRDLWMDIL
jgi:putative endonuclease